MQVTHALSPRRLAARAGLGARSSRMWARLTVAFLVVLSLACVACHRRDRARVDDRRLMNLQRRAARELQCPAVGVEVERLDEHLFRVSGCGGWVDYAIQPRGRHRYGGARWRLVIPLAQRAASELGCPPEQIGFEGRSPRRYAVAGCGRAVELELLCNALDCGWVAATPIHSVAAPTVASPNVSPSAPPSVVVQPAVAPAQPPSGYGATVTVTVQ